MMYLAYQTQSNFMDLFRQLAATMSQGIAPIDNLDGADVARHFGAGFEVLSRLKFNHTRPPFDIDSVAIDGRTVRVVETPVLTTPFATLLHFRKEGRLPTDKRLPKILVVAPLSGHFSTLLKATVRTLLADHDVFITDWHTARDISVFAGTFGFSDYIDHLIRFLEEIGAGAHILAVCQPCVQVLAAVAVMAEAGNPCQPRSMILMAGPIDTRVNPSKVNELATSKPMSWFESNMIATVPWMHKGGGRRVYPGFVQLCAFLAMNIDRHKKAHEEMYDLLAKGEIKAAETIKSFYDEYFSVLDITAEFYLETVDIVFQRALLPKGELTHQGRPVLLSAIRRTALLTVEGERDDICALGQTAVAHDLCTGIKPYMKRHHMQTGAGHYGVFSGRRWETQVFPIVRNLILAMD